MSKVAHYLQQHIVGEVLTARDALEYFSTDESIFKVRPKIIVYPRSTNDVRKLARFTWQLAEKGRVFPLTARGKGTDLTGAAIGEGIIAVFPAHMNKILEIDRTNIATVQPGITFAKLEQALYTHGRTVASKPTSAEFSTVGGAVANNASGEASLKYGSIRDFVRSINIVLANGELITTERLSKKQVKAKKGKGGLEGDIYRALDDLLEQNKGLIEKMQLDVSKNSAGYYLNEVRKKDGSIDLTPLFVGSQGTLGLVTQVRLKTVPHNPRSILAGVYFADQEKAIKTVEKIKEIKPSLIEFIDEDLLEYVKTVNPNLLAKELENDKVKSILLVGFDDSKDTTQKRKVRSLKKVVKAEAVEYNISSDERVKDEIWKIRHSAATMLWQERGNARAIPFIEDAIVPVSKAGTFIRTAKALFTKYKVEIGLWGHAGDGNFHVQPILDLGSVGDRQTITKLADDYFSIVTKLGGSISAAHGDGRIRGPYLKMQYGQEAYELLEKVKQIFDPYGTLNPGVKVGVERKDIVELMRKDYNLAHLYDHMPRT